MQVKRLGVVQLGCPRSCWWRQMYSYTGRTHTRKFWLGIRRGDPDALWLANVK